MAGLVMLHIGYQATLSYRRREPRTDGGTAA